MGKFHKGSSPSLPQIFGKISGLICGFLIYIVKSKNDQAHKAKLGQQSPASQGQCIDARSWAAL